MMRVLFSLAMLVLASSWLIGWWQENASRTYHSLSVYQDRLPELSIAAEHEHSMPVSIEQKVLYAFNPSDGTFSTYRRMTVDRKGAIHKIAPRAIVSFRIGDSLLGVDVVVDDSEITRLKKFLESARGRAPWAYRDDHQLGRFFLACRDDAGCTIRMMADSSENQGQLLDRLMDPDISNRPFLDKKGGG